MTNSPPTVEARRDLARTVLAVLLIGVLIAASFWILRPFLLSVVWAAMIVVATWPMMLKVQARLRRRWVAVAIMSGTMVLIFVVPLVLAFELLTKYFPDHFSIVLAAILLVIVYLLPRGLLGASEKFRRRP